MATVDQIITIKTVEENQVDILQRLETRGVDATGWDPTRVPRGLVAVDADILTEHQTARGAAVRGRFLQDATNVYLDLLGVGWYDEERIPAETAELQLTFSDPLNRGPFELTDRQVAFAFGAPNQLDYTQTGGKITISKGGSAVGFFRAASSGATYNRAPGDFFQFTTTTPYIEISSPAIGSTGSIMTVAGRDVEGDTSYKARCRGKWGILGRGWGEDAINYLVRAAAPEVTKIGINGGLGGGRVNIYLATDTGPVTAATANTVFDYLKDIRRKPVGVPPIKVFPAPIYLQQLTAILYNNTNPNAVSEASSRIVAFQNARNLGDPLFYSRLYEEIVDVASGTVGADVQTPATDIYPAAFSLVQFNITLSAIPPPKGV